MNLGARRGFKHAVTLLVPLLTGFLLAAHGPETALASSGIRMNSGPVFAPYLNGEDLDVSASVYDPVAGASVSGSAYYTLDHGHQWVTAPLAVSPGSSTNVSNVTAVIPGAAVVPGGLTLYLALQDNAGNPAFRTNWFYAGGAPTPGFPLALVGPPAFYPYAAGKDLMVTGQVYDRFGASPLTGLATFQPQNGSTVGSTPLTISPTGSPSQFTYTAVIPGTSVPASGLSVGFTFQDGRWDNPPASVLGTAAFTTGVSGGYLQLTSPLTLPPYTPENNFTITAAVSDSLPGGTVSGQIYYQPTATAPLATIPMNPVKLGAGNFTLTGTVPAVEATASGLNFFLQLADSAGNSLSTPLTAVGGISVAPGSVGSALKLYSPPNLSTYSPDTSFSVYGDLNDANADATVSGLLYYRPADGPSSQYSTVNVSMTPIGDGDYTYRGTIPAADVTAAGLDFHLQFTDSAGASTSTQVVPVGLPVSTVTTTDVIGSLGGSLSSADGAVALAVPSGAFSQNTSLTVQTVTAPQRGGAPSGYVAASPQWSISAGETEPTTPITTTFHYDANALNAESPKRLGVYLLDPATNAWSWIGGRVDPGVGTITADLSQFGTYAVFANTGSFNDLSSAAWAKPAIDTLLGAGIVSGVAPGTFAPNATLTRAQFTKLLVLAAGLSPVASSTGAFKDVAGDTWYAPYVAAAVKADLVQGTSATTFDPEGPITRGEMAVMLARLLGTKNSANSVNFTDSIHIPSWALSGVQAAVQADLIQGFPDGTFQPDGTATRAQAAEVVAKYLKHIGKI